MEPEAPSMAGPTLERIAGALERIDESLDEIVACLTFQSLHSRSVGVSPRARRRRRTAKPWTVEPPSLPFRPSRTLGLEGLARQLIAAAARREPQPWLGVIGVALAETAALATGDWWLLPPLVLCAWWWCPSAWRWTWLQPTGLAVLGAAWITVGVGLIHQLPLLPAGLLWAGGAELLALLATAARALADSRRDDDPSIA